MNQNNMKVTKLITNGVIEYINSNKRLHREDGPAIEYVDSPHEYYLFDIEYTKEEYELKLLNK